jgi:3-oxoacyl-[acyl-carrier protein] reductase
MTKPLEGKVALITGAGKNIGRAIALKLAADGAAIVVNGRSDRAIVDAVAGEITASGGKAVAAMGDVSDARAVEQMMGGVIAQMGGVDIVVSNAGLRRQTPFLDMQLQEWREILSVALDGAFILAKATVPSMIARGGGAFVAMSGISTHIGTPNRCHVSASKSGLEGLMRALAIELAPKKVTFNCVAPGAIDTTRGATAGARPSDDRAVPLGRKGTVDEIAATVRYLVGPEGAYTTGQTIHVNGGVFLT